MVEVLTFRYFPSPNLRHLSPVKNSVVGGGFIRHADIQEIKKRDPSKLRVQPLLISSECLILFLFAVLNL